MKRKILSFLAAGWIEKMMAGSLPVRKELRIKDEDYK